MKNLIQHIFVFAGLRPAEMNLKKVMGSAAQGQGGLTLVNLPVPGSRWAITFNSLIAESSFVTGFVGDYYKLETKRRSIFSDLSILLSFQLLIHLFTLLVRASGADKLTARHLPDLTYNLTYCYASSFTDGT